MNRTKAQTLIFLQNKLSTASILDVEFFSVKAWIEERQNCFEKAKKLFANHNILIVRSSALLEDQDGHSCAGKFNSILNVDRQAFDQAVESVLASYGSSINQDDQILIQPMLKEAASSGVMFTKDPKCGGDYYIINYELHGNTSAITSGENVSFGTQFIAKCQSEVKDPYFTKLISLADELSSILENDTLDIEFAFDAAGDLYLFQVRPLSIKQDNKIDQKHILGLISSRVTAASVKHPHLNGEKTFLGVMPDWNPAEIIGVRPKTLALSLYKELITDSTWAYQRDNYGYKNLRSFPLLIDLMGLPYIDLRVSFNSFVPKVLDTELSERLVNYYLDRLKGSPHLHDKIEFEVTYSCYTFDLPTNIQQLEAYGFYENDITQIVDSLRQLTNRIIRRDNGLWALDLEKIEELKKRHEHIFFNSEFDELTKVYWLIEECKRYGTLPFAGLARAGFIAVQILNSMVAVGVLTAEQRFAFMNSLDSVSSQMTRDLHKLDREHFLKKYGHLRPGTYDILLPRYDEAPDLYFDWEKIKHENIKQKTDFQLSLTQMQQIEKLLEQHGLDHDVVGLFTFIKSAIEGREYSKFVFTKTLSDILSLLKMFGLKNGFSVEDMAYLDIQHIRKLYSSSWDVCDEIRKNIQSGKEKFDITSQIILPPLILEPENVYSFKMPEERPNFITRKSITAKVLKKLDINEHLSGSIIFIPSADPGFDWIFTHDIAGFVTTYGGVNSHMAIRAGELGLPAIIGAGEKLYNQWSSATKIHIDCMNQRVEVLH